MNSNELKKKAKGVRPIIFGEIAGIDEGHWFDSRQEMMPSSFHRNWGRGIDGNAEEGTAAIVLSGGYEDDQDFGNIIIYTGEGGNDPNTKKQIKDQSWESQGNAGLRKSMDEGLPIRVIRGYMHKSELSPKEGYVYAGLYSVVEAWQEIGKSGYKICRFRLEYSGVNEGREIPKNIKLDYKKKEKKRKEGTIVRIVRDTKMAHDIKELYNYECQVCGSTIKTKSGRYAEGAHIKPLGIPHNGDDSPDNLLCLCPNHHVMFNRGCFSIKDDYKLIGEAEGTLKLHDDHKIQLSNLKYHRSIHGYN